MADDKSKQPEQKAPAPEAPRFMVTMAPGFFDGMNLHEPGTEITWVVPEGWDEAKWGKHAYGHLPSTTFRALNKEAEVLLAQARKAAAQR